MASGTMFGLGDPNVFKCSIRFSIENQQCQTGFKLRDLAVQDNTPQTVIDTVDTWVQNSFRPMLGTVDPIIALDVVKMGSEEGAEKQYVGLFGSSNIGADTREPSFLCVNVALKTTLRKRYGQGRMFWPLRTEFGVDGSFLNAGGIAIYEGAAAALGDAFSGSVLTHDLVLVNTHGILPPRAATATTPARPQIPAKWYDVDAIKVNRQVTALRSRKIGIGA